MVSGGGNDGGGVGSKMATEVVMAGRGKEQEGGKEEIESKGGRRDTERERERERRGISGWWKATVGRGPVVV